jgi:hypothetical protein
MDCAELAEALAKAQTREEVVRRALALLEEKGLIACGEAYWVGEGLRLFQMQACRTQCPLLSRSREAGGGGPGPGQARSPGFPPGPARGPEGEAP